MSIPDPERGFGKRGEVMSAMRHVLVPVVAVAAAAAWAIFCPPVVMAQDQVETTYLHYHRVIHAAERCRLDFPFGSTEQSRMAGYIDAKVNNEISAGRRLSLIEKAKHDVDKLVDAHGCSSDIADLLAVYDKELAPLLKP
jgi:hypothetical protein